MNIIFPLEQVSNKNGNKYPNKNTQSPENAGEN